MPIKKTKKIKAVKIKEEKEDLRGLLITKLSALYDIESEIIKALPKMIEAASDEDLKTGLREHLDETRAQALRLEQAFEALGVKPEKIKVDAIRGLVKDAEWVLKNVKGTEALDANIIAAAQYVEHYEMAGYGTAKEWAENLGEGRVAELLETSLEEEKDADEKLNILATSKINDRANTEKEAEETEEKDDTVETDEEEEDE